MPPSKTTQEPKVSPADALRLAREHYMALERIDMQAMSNEMGISRTTLYRWVGDRESLISGMLSEMVTQVIEESVEAAGGEGLDKVLDALRRFMDTSSKFAPLRHLVITEPALALRVMMAPGSAVSRTITDLVQEQIELARPDWPGERSRDLADVLTQIGMAYEWGNIAIESEPEIDRATRAMLLLLTAAD